MVTYRVGSQNEVTGTTGATHLLEHLMFKGPENFNRAKGNTVDQFSRKVGAQYNATTYSIAPTTTPTSGNEHLERQPWRSKRTGCATVAARGRPAARDDRRAQRIRTRRKLSDSGADQGDFPGGLRRPSLSPQHDRLAQRHREGLHRETSRVLRHVLLAQQRHRHDHRRLRTRRGARRW